MSFLTQVSAVGSAVCWVVVGWAVGWVDSVWQLVGWVCQLVGWIDCMAWLLKLAQQQRTLCLSTCLSLSSSLSSLQLSPESGPKLAALMQQHLLPGGTQSIKVWWTRSKCCSMPQCCSTLIVYSVLVQRK